MRRGRSVRLERCRIDAWAQALAVEQALGRGVEVTMLDSQVRVRDVTGTAVLAWSAEVAFANRLKRQGRFVILRESVVTSGRKVRAHSALGLLRVGVRLALGRRSGLEYWYGPHAGGAADAEPGAAADQGRR